jgi:cytochrome d ubiquinol oxidase subunit I
MFSMAMWMAALVAPIQILAGDQHGLNTLEHQPVKIMAMEGHFQSHKDGAPLICSACPIRAAGKVKYAIEIPEARLADPQAFAGCAAGRPRHRAARKLAAGADHFWSFRIMVGMGLLMLGLGLLSLWMRWRGTLYESRLLHIFALAMGPAGFIAVLAGWITTESGASRSPSTACCGRPIRPRRWRRPRSPRR